MINRYENKNIQPPADILNRIANTLNTSVDFLINGHKDEKAIASLKDVEVLKQFKEVEQLEECDRNALLKVITGFIRDCKAKQTYAV
jgi:transcriptional regulator with XRE-family HTH domain